MPYLLLSFQPAWTRVLPRPGAWMEVLKQLTALPLFATVVWLVWVYGRLHTAGGPGGESDHVAYLLLGLLVLAVAGWVLGRWPAKGWGTVTAVLLGALGLAIPLSQGDLSARGTTVAAAASGSSAAAGPWGVYSQAALDAARAAGRPVFIDFTAAWCLSCQVNERLVLKSAEVQQAFAAGHVVLLRADWTQYDPEITKELSSINRSGVPTYVIYPAGVGRAADVLPELLTKDGVLAALGRDLR
jgi:thiol:disulfide interchange protein DsbD